MSAIPDDKGTSLVGPEASPGVQQPPGLERYFATTHAGMMDLTARMTQVEASHRQMREELDATRREKAEKEKFWKDFGRRLFESALTKLAWFIALLVGWGVVKWASDTLKIPGLK